MYVLGTKEQSVRAKKLLVQKWVCALIFKFKCLLGPFMFKSINNKEKTSITVTVSYDIGSGPFDYSVTG